jgi:hypothetical protein
MSLKGGTGSSGLLKHSVFSAWVHWSEECLGDRGQSSKDSSNWFEPAGDRPSNLVGTVLLHEVETSDDDAVLVREAARQSPDSARDEYTGLRVNKELWQRCCFQPCGIGGNPIRAARHLAIGTRTSGCREGTRLGAPRRVL